MMARPEEPSFDDRLVERVWRIDHGLGLMARALAADGAPERTAIDDAACWRYACRAAGAPADLALERALRQDPALSDRYRRMVAARSRGWSPVAAAAAGGGAVTRKLGDYELTFSETGRRMIMTIALPPDAAGDEPPTGIEVFADGDSERIALGAPVRNFITVAFNGERPEDARLFRLFTRPSAAIYLL